MADYRDSDLGVLVQPGTAAFADRAGSFPYAGIDNGCFTEAGRRLFTMERYKELVARCLAAWGERLLFATAPDRVADWTATLALARPVLPVIRSWGCPAAIVLQDGAPPSGVGIPWDEFDAVFVGGSTGWKLSIEAALIAREAKFRGKWVHVGRVNSLRRLRWSRGACWADSADGTFLKFGGAPQVGRLVAWLDAM